MKCFSLRLLAANRTECITDVCSLVCEDRSGSFGLLAGHERFMTVLEFGLARLQLEDGAREYLGFPGGLLYFTDNECRISTRHYLRDRDVTRLAQAFSRELLAEEQVWRDVRHRLQQLETDMLKRLADLER